MTNTLTFEKGLTTINRETLTRSASYELAYLSSSRKKKQLL